MAMAGTGKQPDNNDDAPPTPQRPVSSLLSHFENLSHRRSPSAVASSPRTSTNNLLATPEPSDDPRSSTRASLDLPRPHSPWTPAEERLNPLQQLNGENSRDRGFSGRRYGRPISMNFHRSSPQLPPTLTVQSPQSPPRGQDRDEVWTPQGDSRKTRSPGHRPREWMSVSPAPPRPLSPIPKFGPSVNAGDTIPRLSPGSLRVNLTGSPTDRKLKSASLPPPANRASKPKIPAKPAMFSQSDTGSLTPRTERTSPDRTRPTTEPPTRRSFDERSPIPSTIARHDAREMGFSRTRPGPEPSRATKPLMVQIPSAPVDAPMSAAAAPPLSAQRFRASDIPYDRPGLPPRPSGVPRRTGVSPARESPRHASSSVQPTPIARSAPSFPRASESSAPKPIQRQPSLPQETHLSSSLPERRVVRTDTEEDEQVEEPAISRTDYPDASKANRRPPCFKSGPNDILTKYDTRLLAVCGKYVCTTGYLTRVWDLTTGDQVMSLSHGETVKSLSIAFKPGKGLEDEGQRIWLGTSAGDLHEVDIPSQSIVATRAYPSRREVIQILRHKKEMWTFDDEGRLLVWLPDETGTPNLQYSYHSPSERVARGHTFSMVVDDKLWLAAGKDVHVYRPNAKDDVPFKVFKRPLGLQHSGDVTSGTYTTREGGRVYLGHADGKVTVYSSTDFSCLAVVNVSVYKINCLAFVGDYLWAAYKTGMIYVYDVSTNPWTVKKDWRAHDSPVSSFVLDMSSIWTMNRLQVTSLGTDNCIRLWDGMLEDDWLDARMQIRDVEYCKFREIKAVVVTWNAGASTPGSVRNSDFIRNVVTPEDPPEIVIFGFQELVDLENKKITAKSLLLGSKKKDNGEKEHMSRQYRVWIDHLTRALHECMPLDESYVLLHTANMVGLFTCVFVRHKERHNIKNISASEIKRGMGGLHGNKGALVLRFVLDDSSMCFVNCHLAAGQTQTAHRNNDIAAILEAESLPAENSMTLRSDQFASGGDGSMIMDHEVCILNGDLNYRIDAIPRNVIIDAVRQNNLPKLLDRDQLLASRRKNPGFRLRSFTESPITFAPTYKYDVGTDEYDSSDKKRSPAWCDRILYRGLGRVKQLDYRRHEVRASDHRPVSAAFKIRAKTVLSPERNATWESCNKEFQEEKRRLASETSIEYLITVLGTDPRQARTLILGKQ
ncbi:Endonuclease/exonuclease/phosphatase [Penicillium robsamsonii]|uniref:Endonuclease/exonuclease/phosphatase n=1 Tax=Penicillium robsamsonii TaxID=1792511 RepID=UPI002547D37D|nr:Endonuclease/exonuclease/phosphatase [Penicillium robsamsonii]KAJ5837116.1 Endonuclease/exonuclease/phosphatase [Penicillium robsamsonii]